VQPGWAFASARRAVYWALLVTLMRARVAGSLALTRTERWPLTSIIGQAPQYLLQVSWFPIVSSTGSIPGLTKKESCV
jgi:hypothetical protein